MKIIQNIERRYAFEYLKLSVTYEFYLHTKRYVSFTSTQSVMYSTFINYYDLFLNIKA